ncbi:MAG: aminoacyl-tRNA hydrolase [Hyphomicrobiales bacterium]|nr:MAG: aminoacyl-tRNA hydrolase [Hyphomicrobiales bacterium]
MADPVLTIPESELSESFIRSSGPGGQNVNKVSTGVQLKFNVRTSPSLSQRAKEQLVQIASHLMSKSGVLQIEATHYRTQVQNREDARLRLARFVAEASKPPPKKRRPTRPSRGSVERRLKKKAGRSFTKKMRNKGSYDD